MENRRFTIILAVFTALFAAAAVVVNFAQLPSVGTKTEAAASALLSALSSGRVSSAASVPFVDYEESPGNTASASPEKAVSKAVSSKAVSKASSRASSKTATVSFPLDLNAADESSLDAIPGIGPVLAGRIVAYRKENGAFQNVEELKNVKGIGDKIYEKISPYVTVRK